MSRTIEEALAAAEAAGYRMDLLLRRPSSNEAIASEEPEPADPVSEQTADSATEPA
jgi:hypothetical protein